MKDNQLYHFGIKGQRWGIRRYQNQDGSLTPAGKKRYRQNDHQDYKNAHDGRKSRQLSTNQLNKRNARFQAQKQYESNIQSPSKRAVKKAAKKVGLILVGVGAAAVTQYLSTIARQKVNKGGDAVRDYASMKTKSAIKKIKRKKNPLFD